MAENSFAMITCKWVLCTRECFQVNFVKYNNDNLL